MTVWHSSHHHKLIQPRHKSYHTYELYIYMYTQSTHQLFKTLVVRTIFGSMYFTSGISRILSISLKYKSGDSNE